MFRGSAFNLSLNTLESLLQQIFKIPSHAIDRKETQVVYVELPLLVCVPDLRRINTIQPILRGNIRRKVIIQSLERIAHIAVFLDFPVLFLNIMFNHINTCLGRYFPYLGMLFPIQDICLGRFVKRGVEKNPFYNILNFFHLRKRSETHFVGQGQDPECEFSCISFSKFPGCFPGLSNCCVNF